MPRVKGKNGKLTPLQLTFVAAYALKPNATAAAIEAGYSEKTATNIGSHLLTLPHIQEAIKQKRTVATLKYDVSKERIVAEYAKLALSNMADYTMIDEATGELVVDFRGADRDQLAAVQSVDQQRTTQRNARGSGETETVRTRFKLADKIAALDGLAKITGAVIDRHEINAAVKVEVEHQHQLDIAALAPEEREQLKQLLDKASRVDRAGATDVEDENDC